MNLIIVESPSKAKTIEKYLGTGYRVIASVGHVRDLVPENGSVDTENDFAMKWQIMPGKEKQIKLILDEVKKADAIYLASDPDREGEAISWHLLDILNSKKALNGKKVYRATFHEITKKAVEEALANPREIDQNLVDAYLVRRALDYLIGFGISPLLWRRNLGKSAGRVQSVAVKLVVDREREIEAFNPQEYWSLIADCAKDKAHFESKLTRFDSKKIDKMTIAGKDIMDKILSVMLVPIAAIVDSVEKKKSSRKPTAPFTTSTLQQEAARKLYFSSKRTMMAAQHLYEQGLITYMRTDATSLSADAVSEIRTFISREYGADFLPKTANIYITKSKNAQEAHEAIRPTHFDTAGHSIDGDEARLYELIWKRTIACQMTNAEFDSVVVDITSAEKSPDFIFHTVGTVRTFDGFMRVYTEDGDEKSDDTDDKKLPTMSVGDKITIEQLLPAQHFTQPPARFTEASLIKKLEELGIGRPSTYASIMSTIVERKYIDQDKQRRFTPTSGGWVLSAYLANYFADLVDVNFTSKTEDSLDDVSNGTLKKTPTLSGIWTPTQKMIEAAAGIKTTEIIDKINVIMHDHLFKGDGGDKCPKCNGNLSLKLSRFGPFVGCENYPTCDYTARLGTEMGADDAATTQSPGELDLGGDIKFKTGRFGPYVTDGKKNASAKKYTSDTITLEIATELLSSEKEKVAGIDLGINPKTKKPILYFSDGRFGAYISSNKVNVSVKSEPDLNTAADLINNKKPSTRFKKKA